MWENCEKVGRWVTLEKSKKWEKGKKLKVGRWEGSKVKTREK